MANEQFDKSSWTDLFREIGLDEAQMHRWHALFEQRWPEAHQSFLVWLGVQPSDIARIRESSRGDWSAQ